MEYSTWWNSFIMQTTAQFKPTVEDHIKTSKAFLIPIKIGVVAGLLLIEVFFGTYALNVPELLTRADWFTPFTLPCVAPMIGTIVLFAWPLMNDRKIKNYVEKNEQLLGTISWTFSEDEVVLRSADSEITYDWRAFHDGIEIKEYFLLSHPANNKTYFFIPKSSFRSKDEQEGFVGLFEKKTKRKLGKRTFAVSILMPLVKYLGFIALMLLTFMYIFKLTEVIF